MPIVSSSERLACPGTRSTGSAARAAGRRAGLGGAHERLEAARPSACRGAAICSSRSRDEQPDRARAARRSPARGRWRFSQASCFSYGSARPRPRTLYFVRRSADLGRRALGEPRPARGSGPISLRPTIRDARSPAYRTRSRTGAASADQRLDPAPPRELGGTAVGHGRAIVDSPACGSIMTEWRRVTARLTPPLLGCSPIEEIAPPGANLSLMAAIAEPVERSPSGASPRDR